MFEGPLGLKKFARVVIATFALADFSAVTKIPTNLLSPGGTIVVWRGSLLTRHMGWRIPT
ncbi:hypothetical protein C7476_11565 [Phyllobacterium bourgognense]|uniref:Uncharacterized protein n=1 Tax=Phyllobacterium bourgognense TaxID=314236 RepID=A0A368YIP3_9HYPH|nr:hypothetical protein C7476_11565 [Phyllobacterium bourgognense]